MTRCAARRAARVVAGAWAIVREGGCAWAGADEGREVEGGLGGGGEEACEKGGAEFSWRG